MVRVLGLDFGRTATKACVSGGDGEASVILIPSNVAHLEVNQVRCGRFESSANGYLTDIWLEYQGRGYALGHLGSDFGADLGVGQSKVQDSLIKMFAAAGYFGLSGDIVIVVALPFHSQDQFEREKNELIGSLKAPHQVIYRGKPVEIDVHEVWVMPEGFGSLIWCDSDQEMTTSYFRDLSVAVVDIGHETTDFLMVDEFRFARGASKSESHGMARFYDRVAELIPGADSQSASLIEAVHRPQGERFFRPRGQNRPTDLDELLPSLRRHFAREISDLLLSWLPERATEVVVCGGGGEYFWNELHPLLKLAGLKGHLPGYSREASSVGQFLFGESQISIPDDEEERIQYYSYA